MKTLIKLTRYDNGEPAYINPEYIISIATWDRAKTTISLLGEDWDVKETPAQIALLCAAGCVELVDDAAVELVPRLR